MDKIKTKIALYKTILGITIGSAIYGGLNAKAYNDNVEHLAEVPSTLRYQLYYGETIDSELPAFNPKSNRVDELVTYEVLDKLHHLTVDLSSTADLSYLLKCHNLQSISIFYSEYLTPEQIAIINKCSADELTLYFENPEVNRENYLDLNVFKNKKITINFYPTEELEALVFLNYIKNYESENVTANLIGQYSDVSKLFMLDDKLNEIIDSLDIKESDSDYDKLLKIVKYVNDKIEYDHDISDYLDNKNADVDTYFQLSNYYNQYDISSIILNDGNDVEGVCVNYANLLDILCYKTGVKTRTVSGANNRCGHAWNIVYLNDTRSYVDLTSADTTYINRYIDQYFNATDSKEKERCSKTIDTLLLMSLNTHKDFQLSKNINELDSTPRIIEVNYNEGLDGKDVLHTELPKKKFALIGFGSVVMLFGTYELAKRVYMYLKAREQEELEYYLSEPEEECVIYDFNECKKLIKKDGK